MTLTTLNLDGRVYDYILSNSLRETALLRRLREETATYPNPNMQIAPDQGQFLALLLRILGARKVIELGVFTGYSSLWMAGALPEDGRIIACDINADYTRVARRYWAEAGVAHQIAHVSFPVGGSAELLCHSLPGRNGQTERQRR